MSFSHDRSPGTSLPPPPNWLTAAGLPWPWAGLIALAVTAQLALIWNHVPWADELQATALARESHTLADWYWNFRYEGHPPLWHLLLKIPLAFTDDPTALKIVQSVLVLCSAALLHLRAPFSPGVKFLLSLNYFLFFEYGVIARNYSLTVLFFFGAIAFRRQPVAWLFIALLPQGGLQSVMLAGICGIIALREQGWKWWGVLLAGCGGVVALAWMWPTADFESYNTLRLAEPLQDRIMRTLYLQGNTFLPVDGDLQLTGWRMSRLEFPIMMAGVIWPLILTRTVARHSILLASLMLCFVVSNFILSSAVYALMGRHFGLWVLLWIGTIWTLHKPGEPVGDLARIWMIMLALSGTGAAIGQISEPPTEAQQAAAALRVVGGGATLIIPVPVLLGAEVNGLLHAPTVDMVGKCLQTFVRWRSPVFMTRGWRQEGSGGPGSDVPHNGLEEMKLMAARAGGRALLVMDSEIGAWFVSMNDPALTFLQFLGTDTPYDSKRYLYRLDVPPDPNPTPIPPCTR